MTEMGKQRVIDKTIQPLTTGLTTITPAQTIPDARRAGVLPIGAYKGGLAFLDLDKIGNQPLAAVEGLYALDILDARYIVTATMPAASALNAAVRARLGPVPAGELWILNRVVLISPAALVAEQIQVNFRISYWQATDIPAVGTIDPDGRSYWPAAQGTVGLDTFTVDFPAQGQIGTELRLPAGATITLVAILVAGAPSTGALNATLTPFGRKARLLVV